MSDHLLKRDVRRPVSIAVVAISLSIAACIALTVGIALLFPGTFLDKMWQYNRPAYAVFQTMGRSLGVAFIALALLAAGAAAGLLRGRRWAWWLAVGIFATNGLGEVITMRATRDLVRSGSGILFAVAFLTLLMSHKVRDSLD